MNVLCINQSDARMGQKLIKNWLQKIEKSSLFLKPHQKMLHKKSIIIVYVTSKNIKKLNRDFRSINKSTDILSFESLEKKSELGELVISPVDVKKNAAHNGWSFQRELKYVLLHGVLHLLGYDHIPEESLQARRMYALQDKIFQSSL